jgi:hypothetical protein
MFVISRGGRGTGRRAGPRDAVAASPAETAAVGRSGRRRSLRRRSVLATVALLGASVTGAVATTLITAPTALATTVPAPPTGWNTVFSDNFAGTAGSPPSAANWFYDIGTGYGTGEIENTTNSTNNAYLDGNGHLVLKAIDNGGTWTSARLESTRDDFQAPAGGELEMTASIEQPDPANGLGYWPAFWALGSPMRAGGGWPQSGEIDMMEDVNGLNEASQTLHDSANSPGHALIACPDTSSTCETGYHTYSVIINRTNTSAETLEYLMDGTVESTITEASVGTTAWQDAIDHGFFIIWDLAMGGNYPNGIYGATTPTAATSSGASMSVAYVAVYEEGGNSTPTGTATATGAVKGVAGLCLANQNALNTEGNPITAAACDSDAGQQWSPYTDGTVRTQGGCLDVVAAGTTAGTTIDWYACNATPAQNWTPETNGELLNPNSGLCLTDTTSGAGTQLELEACTDAANQQWTIPTGGTTPPPTTPPPTTPPPSGDAPYGGTPAAVPGTVQAENYDTGGQGVAYNVTAVNGTANSYRSDGVDLEGTTDTGGGDDLGWTGAGQWFHYTVNVATAGTYTLGLRVAAPTAVTDALHIDNSTGTNLSGNVNIPATGGYQTWTTVNTTVTLPAGVQTLTLDQDNAGWNINYFTSASGSTGGGCGTTDLALNKTATASSEENASFPPQDAVDGNTTGTRWSSAFSDPQWLEVDLGSTQTICQVALYWETAYATAFQIQTSTDNVNWTTIYSTTTGTGGNQTLNVTGSGRYIRMYGTARDTQYGYSLWEFEVFG